MKPAAPTLGETAGAVIIGDEILSGKVRDVNSACLIEMLARRGVALRRLLVIPDVPEEIGAAVKESSEAYDHVFTSGGVGPTHDDLTVGAIAAAFGVPVVPHPELVALIEREIEARPERSDELSAALKMAEVPEGAVLLGGGPYPIITFRNIFILPGVPQIFAGKIAAIAERIGGSPLVVRRVYLSAHESAVAERLAAVQRDVADVRIGSYPRYGHSDYRVMVTLEHAEEARVDDAVTRLQAVLRDDEIARID